MAQTQSAAPTWKDDVLELLGECEEYFDGRADAEYFTDSPWPVPNSEMVLLCCVRELIARAKES